MSAARPADSRDGESAALAALIAARSADPFALLGPHGSGSGRIVRAFLPGAAAVSAVAHDGGVLADLAKVRDEGLFAGRLRDASDYRLRVQ